MANKTRGEIALTLEGVEYTLRPSYEAIQAFEDQTGKGIIELGRAALEGKLSVREAAIVATECIKAWGRATENASAAHVNAEKVGQLMFEAEDGVAGAMAAVATILALAATGGYTAKGEVKAGTAKK